MKNGVLLRHAVSATGSGPPLVLVHGFGCDQLMWHQIRPALEAHHTVITYDLAGFGRSDPSHYGHDRHDTLSGHAQDLLEILAELDVDNATFVGHSVGAMIAAEAAVLDPNACSQVIMLCPNPYFLSTENYHGGFDQRSLDEILDYIEADFEAWTAAMASLVAQSDARSAPHKALQERFCANNPDITHHFAQRTFFTDCRNLLPQLSQHVHIIQTRTDVLVPESVTEFMQHEIPETSVHWIEGKGHAPHLSHPEETIAAIQAATAA